MSRYARRNLTNYDTIYMLGKVFLKTILWLCKVKCVRTRQSDFVTKTYSQYSTVQYIGREERCYTNSPYFYCCFKVVSELRQQYASLFLTLSSSGESDCTVREGGGGASCAVCCHLYSIWLAHSTVWRWGRGLPTNSPCSCFCHVYFCITCPLYPRHARDRSGG